MDWASVRRCVVAVALFVTAAGLDASEVGVIALYRAQVSAIQNAFPGSQRSQVGAPFSAAFVVAV